MKKLISMLGIFTLISTSSAPMLNTPILFKQETNKLPRNLITTIILENYQIFKQVQDDFCGPAAVQSVLNFLIHQSPSQEELGRRLGNDWGGTRPGLVTEVLNSYIDAFDYEHNLISRNFGTWEADMIMFQDAITFSLTRNIPAILMFNGQIPWAPSIIGGHMVPITGIEINDNAALTRYQVAEAGINEGEFRWFTGAELRNMFANGNGSLLLSTPRFNFWNSRITLPVNNSEGSIHQEVSDEAITVSETVNLLNEAGIVSQLTLQKAKKIELPGFSLHYLWNNHTYDNIQDIWSPENLVPELGWTKDYRSSKQWDDDDEGEAYINLYINQTLTEDMNLKLMYKVEGEKIGPRNMPYVDLTMGRYWYIDYTDKN